MSDQTGEDAPLTRRGEDGAGEPTISRQRLVQLTHAAIDGAGGDDRAACVLMLVSESAPDYLWPSTLWVVAHAELRGSVDPTGALLDCLIAAAVPQVVGTWINERRATRIVVVADSDSPAPPSGGASPESEPTEAASPNRWAPFTDAEVVSLADGLDAWDGETNSVGRGEQPYAALDAELAAELRARGLVDEYGNPTRRVDTGARVFVSRVMGPDDESPGSTQSMPSQPNPAESDGES